MLQDYGNIEQMNLVENLEKVKFTKELSLFPEYVNCKEFIEKVFYIPSIFFPGINRKSAQFINSKQ